MNEVPEGLGFAYTSLYVVVTNGACVGVCGVTNNTCLKQRINVSTDTGKPLQLLLIFNVVVCGELNNAKNSILVCRAQEGPAAT